MKEVKLKELYPTLRFLIIDDFESFRSSLRLMLSSFGAQQVDMASNADDAMAKCKYNFYDVILCDFNLGPGKNGQQILEELRVRKRLKHTHIFIMITAETAKDVVLGTREYAPDGYIAKPITRTTLEKRLGHLLIQQKTLKKINREIDLENYSKAISLCHKMMQEKNRYQSWCYQTLAKLYTLVGDNASATQIYQDILAGREIPWARIGMGEILNLEQQYQKAKTCFKDVITNNPNLVEAYDGISHACQKLGQSKESQEALQEAVNLSPRMVPRQEKLGGICQKNHDIEAAAKAYRMAVQYGENSVHDKSDHYLNLGRCLADWSEHDVTEAGRSKAQEAVEVLNKVSDRFSEDDDSCVNAMLIEARVYQGQHEDEAAIEKLHQAECMIEEESVSASVGLELAKTLYSMKQDDRAEKILLELSNRFADQPAIIHQIESLMDEPEGLKSRQKAKELNKNGITLFEQGELQQAATAIKEALEYTPRHAALNLNLVQILIKQHAQTPNPTLLSDAFIALERIKHIPEQHNQFRRLQHLKKMVSKLEDS